MTDHRRAGGEGAATPVVRGAAAQIAGQLLGRETELTAQVTRAIEVGVTGLDDPDLLEILHASVQGNVVTILHMLHNQIPLRDLAASPAATEYALRLARQGVPGNALRRAYHFGADTLIGDLFDAVRALDADPDLQWDLVRYLAGWVNEYVDRVSQLVLASHQRELEALREHSTSVVAQLVAAVLDGDHPDEFTDATGYELDGDHRAAILWAPGSLGTTDETARLRDLSARLGRDLHARAKLFNTIDRATAEVWFAVPHGDPAPGLGAVHDRMRSVDGIRGAFGTVVSGPAGFRRSHTEATRVRALMASVPDTRSVLAHDEGAVGILTLLIDDPARLAAWVRATLGDLGADDERAAGLRETIRVVLGEQGNHSAAAERLAIHRNSIRYRIDQAEKLRGAPISRGRLDLELALEAMHLLGAAHFVDDGSRTTSAPVAGS